MLKTTQYRRKNEDFVEAVVITRENLQEAITWSKLPDLNESSVGMTLVRDGDNFSILEDGHIDTHYVKVSTENANND